MSSPQGERDIVRLRTFASDFERAKKHTAATPSNAATQNTAYVPSKVSPVIAPPISKTPKPEVLHEEVGTALDDGGVTFDQDVGNKVTEQAYEENQAVTKAENALQDEVLKIPGMDEVKTLTSAPKASLLSDSDDSFRTFEEGDDLGRGSIIRDIKHERFRLIPAIIESVNNWFTEKKDTYVEAHEEKYTVSKTQERVETIKAAAQQKTQTPDEDYQQVAARLQQTKRNPRTENTVALKPKEEEAPPQWSHTVGNQPTDEVSQNSEGNPIQENKQAAPITYIKQPIERSAQLEEEIPEVTLPEPDLTPTQAPTPRKMQLSPRVAAYAESQEQAQTQAAPVPKRSFAQSPILVVAVVLIATTLGISTSFYFFSKKSDVTQIQNITSVRSLIATKENIPVAYSNDHAILYSEILKAVQGNTGSSIHVYPVEVTADGEQRVSIAVLAAMTTPNAPGSFTRAITDINFGGMYGKPFIIFKVTNFDTAFAGMLAWEQTMSADLSPLFGQTVYESFDPFARTSTQVREAFFKDVVISNLSARLLVDETGKDRLIYTFTDKNTIVITTTREAIPEITALIP